MTRSRLFGTLKNARKKPMPEPKETIKEFIESGNRFLIAAEPSADEATQLAAHALRKVLELKNKDVLSWPTLAPSFQEKFSSILPIEKNFEIPQKIRIRIPKTIPLEEMRYDEEGDALYIVLSPKEPVEPAQLTIEKAPFDVDAAFCFFNDESRFENIAIPVNKPAREKTVYLTRNTRTFAEKVHDIYETLNDPPLVQKEIATLLFASLIYETENLQTMQSEKTFRLAGSLLAEGAEQMLIHKIMEEEKAIGKAQFFGRALARTTCDPGLKTTWTFLALKDFEKTKNIPAKELFISLLKKIRLSIEHQPFSVLCYEQNSEGGITRIQTMVFGENKNLLTTLAQRFGVEATNHYFFGPSFHTFSEAETKLKQLLRGVQSDTMKV